MDPRHVFLVEFTAPASRSIKHDLLKRYRGLDEIIRAPADPGNVRILTAWRSRDDFALCQDAILAELGGAQVSWQTVSERFAAVDRWKGVKLGYSRVVTVVAVLATLAALQDNYRWLFASPQIEVFTDKAGTQNILWGEASSIPVHFRNVGHYDAELSIRHRWNKTDATTIVPKLEAGESTVVGAPVRPDTVGESELEVWVDMSSGLLWPAKKLRKGIAVASWPRLALGRPTLGECSETNARCSFELIVGTELPSGASLSAELERVTDVTFYVATGHVSANEVQEPVSATTTGSEYAILEWRTLPLAAMRRYGFDVHLRSTQPRNQLMWEDTCSRLRLGHH